MKSRTSSCNMRVFKKDLTRFAPIWLEYSALLLVIFYFLSDGDYDITNRYSWFLNVFAYVNAVYGFVCAVGLFGYLSDPKECNAVHAFPIRIEEYFIVHLTAGFLMALVPNAVFCLLNISLVTNSILVTFGAMMLQFIFFYALAIFCVFLTGRKFAAATMYALFNCLSILIMWALEVIYLPLLPGVELNTEVFYNFCPVIMMSFEDLIALDIWHGLPSSQMQAIILYAVVGLVLLAVSLILYRRRKLEYAGDFIAVKWLTPVFVVALSIACGCLLGAFTTVFGMGGSTKALLAIGLVVGYFTGMMLLKRTVRVFNLKAIGGAVAVVAVIFLSIFVTELDPFGRVNYVPDAQDVASIQVSQYSGSGSAYKSTDPAVIADVVELHGDILEAPEFDPDSSYSSQFNSIQFHLTYKLKNGQTVVRSYRVENANLLPRINYYYSQPEVMLGVSTLEELKEKCQYINLEYYPFNEDGYADVASADALTGAQGEALLEVIFRECKEGKMNRYSYKDTSSIYITISSNNYCYLIDVSQTAVDTRAMVLDLLDVTQE